MNVALVTLGCTKNQVDSEMILGLLKQKGFQIITDSTAADIIIVNTCGFIESAKQEAIETILAMSDLKTLGRCQHLIVTGCLAKRYKKEILAEMKEVDLCIGVDEYDHIDSILSTYFDQTITGKLAHFDRLISSPFPSCYIRVADGCDNKCSYCAIPLIRGSFKSRRIEEIVEEVKLLAAQGFSEFNLISQDTTKYGLDIYGKLSLDVLLKEIANIEQVKWIRILYLYSYEMTDELLEEIKHNKKVCHYFDIPIQHSSNKVLRAMNRKDSKEIIYQTCNKIRSTIEDAILRTTVIVGFPGESQEEFEELLQTIQELSFDKLGAFTFSPEEDTKAYGLPGQIAESVKEERLARLLTLQQDISYQNNQKHIGKQVEVLVEEVSQDEQYFIARSYMDAPDVDGKILIPITKQSAAAIIVGEYINVQIQKADIYDLYATVV